MGLKQYNYDKLAIYYDTTELKATDSYEKINDFLSKIFKKNKVKTILDMTCGTGAQTIGLKKRGFDIVGSDISKGMLKVAKKKAKGLGIRFYQRDIRKSKFGKFDAVIAIFNAIGHLSEKDFEKAIRNVSKNLKERGLFIFDIFNLNFMKKGFIKNEFIDVADEINGVKFVRFNKNKLDLKKGIMNINQKTYTQDSLKKPKIIKESWAMKIYTKKRLKGLLEKNGFKVVKSYGGSGSKFDETKSLSIYTIAKKTK